MGLTLVEALENLLARVDTPGVRMFSRSIAQGETMGVSTGQIMRNLAMELRKRQRAYAEERAQKAPVKILFPILFLIMPALFIVLLLPVMISDHGRARLAAAVLRAQGPEPHASPRGRPGRRGVGRRSPTRRGAGSAACSGRRTCRRARASSSAPRGRSTRRSCGSRSTSSSSTPTRSWSRSCRTCGPFSTASCRGAREVVELRAGECERRGLALGDRVAWAARAADEAAPLATVTDLEGARRGAVVLASTDQRYLKLVRFLLDGKGIGVAASVPPQRAAEVAGGESADVVVIDAGAVTEGFRIANITRARRPEATVVLVGENVAGSAAGGMRVYEKWDETEGVVDAIEHAIERKAV